MMVFGGVPLMKCRNCLTFVAFWLWHMYMCMLVLMELNKHSTVDTVLFHCVQTFFVLSPDI